MVNAAISELTETVLQLPREERQELILRVLDSLQGHTLTEAELAENQKAWEEETLRIAREVDEGRVQLIPWEEVRARVFGRR